MSNKKDSNTSLTQQIADLIKQTVKEQTGKNLKHTAALELAAKVHGHRSYNHANAQTKERAKEHCDPYVIIYEEESNLVMPAEYTFPQAAGFVEENIQSRGHAIYVVRKRTLEEMQAQVEALSQLTRREMHSCVWLAMDSEHGLLELLCVAPKDTDVSGFEYAEEAAEQTGVTCTGLYNLESLAKILGRPLATVQIEPAKSGTDEKLTAADFELDPDVRNFYPALSEVLEQNAQRDAAEEPFALYLAEVALGEIGETPSGAYRVYVAAQNRAQAKENATQWADEALDRKGQEFFSCDHALKMPLCVIVTATAVSNPDEEDEGVAGDYAVWLEKGYTDLSGAALDQFHSEVGVGNLECFEFSCKTATGKALRESDGYQSYSHTSSGIVEKIYATE